MIRSFVAADGDVRRAAGGGARSEPGKTQPSFDKQFVRDWANAAGWDHNPPAPELPDDVVSQTQAKYREAYERITGRSL